MRPIALPPLRSRAVLWVVAAMARHSGGEQTPARAQKNGGRGDREEGGGQRMNSATDSGQRTADSGVGVVDICACVNGGLGWVWVNRDTFGYLFINQSNDKCYRT